MTRNSCFVFKYLDVVFFCRDGLEQEWFSILSLLFHSYISIFTRTCQYICLNLKAYNQKVPFNMPTAVHLCLAFTIKKCRQAKSSQPSFQLSTSRSKGESCFQFGDSSSDWINSKSSLNKLNLQITCIMIQLKASFWLTRNLKLS